LVKKCFVIQIGDIVFYKFLLSIGLTPRKTKTIGSIKIPQKYFLIFLEGVLMEMGVLIRILIQDGKQVLCFI